MSNNDVTKTKQYFKFCDLFRSSFSPSIHLLFSFLILYHTSQIMCDGIIISEKINETNKITHINISSQRLWKRSSGKFCLNSSDCAGDLPGSLCMNNKCTCPQGYLPNSDGIIGCFQVGKNLGDPCNISSQCGEELSCTNHVCLCPEGFQLFHTEGTNLCLFWHRPTRLVERCRSNEDCSTQDVNSVCKKRWCQCGTGYQLFETMLFGRKHRCFKTHKQQCINSSQCSKLAESSDQYCFCFFGVCHCMPNANSTLAEVYQIMQGDRSNWYQRWKKDIILATRLLFITVILFFVPCFIYVTLGVRERSRRLFSQFVQPSRSPAVHYSQRRSSYTRPMRYYRSVNDSSSMNSPTTTEARHVEILLNNSSGINSRLVNYQPRGIPALPLVCPLSRGMPLGFEGVRDVPAKEEDPPPSYDEIMHNENAPEAPPPPYREL